MAPNDNKRTYYTFWFTFLSTFFHDNPQAEFTTINIKQIVILRLHQIDGNVYGFMTTNKPYTLKQFKKYFPKKFRILPIGIDRAIGYFQKQHELHKEISLYESQNHRLTLERYKAVKRLEQAQPVPDPFFDLAEYTAEPKTHDDLPIIKNITDHWKPMHYDISLDRITWSKEIHTEFHNEISIMKIAMEDIGGGYKDFLKRLINAEYQMLHRDLKAASNGKFHIELKKIYAFNIMYNEEFNKATSIQYYTLIPALPYKECTCYCCMM